MRWFPEGRAVGWDEHGVAWLRDVSRVLGVAFAGEARSCGRDSGDDGKTLIASTEARALDCQRVGKEVLLGNVRKKTSNASC